MRTKLMCSSCAMWERAACCHYWMTTRFICGSWSLAPPERWEVKSERVASVCRKWAATPSPEGRALRAAGIAGLFEHVRQVGISDDIAGITLFALSVPRGWLSSTYWDHVTCSASEQREAECIFWNCLFSLWKTATHSSRIRSCRGETLLEMTE